MRRLRDLLLLAAVAMAVLLPAQVAAANVAPAPVAATQAHLPEDFPGPTPGTANAEGNEFKPVEYEPNFLWGAAVGLSVLTVAGVGLLGALYWAMVVKPKQESAA